MDLGSGLPFAIRPPALICGYRVTELPDALPRVDTITGTADPLVNSAFLALGTRATVSGEGFSAVTAVAIEDTPVRIVSQSDDALEIEIPTNLDLTPQRFNERDIRLLRGVEVLWRVRVKLRPR